MQPLSQWSLCTLRRVSLAARPDHAAWIRTKTLSVCAFPGYCSFARALVSTTFMQAVFCAHLLIDIPSHFSSFDQTFTPAIKQVSNNCWLAVLIWPWLPKVWFLQSYQHAIGIQVLQYMLHLLNARLRSAPHTYHGRIPTISSSVIFLVFGLFATINQPICYPSGYEFLWYVTLNKRIFLVIHDPCFYVGT